VGTDSTEFFQVLLLTQERHTGQVLGLDQVGSDKVLAASISSTSVIHARSLLVLDMKAHGRCALAEDTMCKSFLEYKSQSLKLIHTRPLGDNPFNFWGKVLDCGDIPVTSYVDMSLVWFH
jgi:hypothetical protein